MNYFYTKYIVIENLIEEFHQMDLSKEEQHHLALLVDSSLHHAILDEILSNLSEQDKKLFLKSLKEDPENEKLMDFLKDKVEGVEEKIKKVADDLVKEMHEDIKKAKEK